MNLKNKKVVVVGFGKTGFDVAQFLLRKNAKVFITDIDTGEEKYENLKKLDGKVEFEFGSHSPEFFKNKDLVVISPGINENVLPEIVREGKMPVISEIELAYLFSPSKKIIGITGTNGKTTTTLLTGNIFKFSPFDFVVCGNIGNTFIGEVDNIKKDTYIIIEISSFQLEKIEKFKPFIGVILNIADDHFDRYSDFSQYVKAKEKLFLNKEENTWAVLNGDDKNCFKIWKVLTGKKLVFGFLSSFDIYFKDGFIYSGNEKIIDFNKTKLSGKGNVYNVMAAVSIGKICNIKKEIIEKAIVSFTPPEHRMEKVREIEGVIFINDSKATNPHAVENALESLPDGKVILLMGGLDKGLSFSSLKEIVKRKVKTLVLFGKAKEKIEKELKIEKIKKVETLEEAVEVAYSVSEKGDIVLLSPGCASFDQFKNYKERGNVYKRKVSNIL